METLKASDKRLISYGIDLGTRVTTLLDSSSNIVREVHFRRGLVTTKNSAREIVTYTVKNVDAKPKTLIIERQLRDGYKVLNIKPSETTTKSNRFEVKLAANQEQQIPITEERQLDESFSVNNITHDLVAYWSQNKALTPAGRQVLEKLLAKQDEITAASNDMNVTTAELNEIIKDQERLRQNLGSLNRVAGQQELVQKYVKDMTDQETKIAQHRDRTSELRKKKIALESELSSLLEKLEF